MTDDLNTEYLEHMVNRSRYQAASEKYENVPDVESPRDQHMSPRSSDHNIHERPNSPKSVSLHSSPAASPGHRLHSPIRSPVQSPLITTHRVNDSNPEFDEKKNALVEIRQLRSKGAYFSKMFTFEDSLEDMKIALELARIEIVQDARDHRNKAGIKTARRILCAGISALEFLTKKWNPLKLQLDGFGEYVMGNIDDYDNVFERLLDKYQGNGTMEPEMELVIILGTSAVMFHISNKLVNNAMPAMPVYNPSQFQQEAPVDASNRFEQDDD